MNRPRAATSTATETFRALRDQLLDQREDYAAAYRDFRWPELAEFNWALDWFDAIAAGNDRPALRVVAPDGSDEVLSFAQLSARSNQVANWLRGHGVARGDHVIVMLGNQVELWETILAATKLGAVIIPATTLLGRDDLVDRVRARQRPPRRCHRRRRRQVRRGAGRLHPDRRGRRGRRLAGLRRLRVMRRPSSRPTARPGLTTRCCSTSPPAPPPSPSWSSTRTRPTRSATCRPCTGSGSSRATST